MTSAQFLATMIVLASCSSDPVALPGISFPTYDADGPHPLALLDGTLEVHEGCVYIRAEHGGRFVGLWPREYRPERVDDAFRIVDELGEVLAIEGGPIRVGGGEREASELGGFDALESWFAEIGGTTLPRGCGDLFWQVSGIELG